MLIKEMNDRASMTNDRILDFDFAKPMAYVDGVNLYQFVDDNPNTFVDPFGTDAIYPHFTEGQDYSQSAEGKNGKWEATATAIWGGDAKANKRLHFTIKYTPKGDALKACEIDILQFTKVVNWDFDNRKVKNGGPPNNIHGFNDLAENLWGVDTYPNVKGDVAVDEPFYTRTGLGHPYIPGGKGHNGDDGRFAWVDDAPGFFGNLPDSFLFEYYDVAIVTKSANGGPPVGTVLDAIHWQFVWDKTGAYSINDKGTDEIFDSIDKPSELKGTLNGAIDKWNGHFPTQIPDLEWPD